ncbi:hypothetical protein SLOPH_1069 [Spraguea lophii 42_110]|uniref:Uncharacterized protein n=1 Tax=Spraguea lophii (strain 42_110) TaxID=1358809 RepID=S7WA35_SPRLO|nr:hypothetical protein SLOPH_1069 [Spraguea lophii 42_110]
MNDLQQISMNVHKNKELYSNVKSMLKYNITVHNLYFHDNASIYTIDSYKNIIVTGGGDKSIRIWRIYKNDKEEECDIESKDKSDINDVNYNDDINENNKSNTNDITITDNNSITENITITNNKNKDKNIKLNYYTAINSFLKLQYISTYTFASTINCVRINSKGIIACTDDNGYLNIIRNKYIVDGEMEYRDKDNYDNVMDNKNVITYATTGEGGEVEWINHNMIVVGYSNGRVCLFKVEYNCNEECDKSSVNDKSIDNGDNKLIDGNGDNKLIDGNNNMKDGVINQKKKIRPRIVENKNKIILLHSLKLHSSNVVGLAYNKYFSTTENNHNNIDNNNNNTHTTNTNTNTNNENINNILNKNILVTVGKDRIMKILEIKENKLSLLHSIKNIKDEDRMFVDDSRGILFRRLGFSPSLKNSMYKLLYVCSTLYNKKNSVYILHYPYYADCIFGVVEGFDGPVVKVVFDNDYVYYLCRTSLYVGKIGSDVISKIENFTFRMMTDATIVDGVLLCTSVDGFITSLECVK